MQHFLSRSDVTDLPALLETAQNIRENPHATPEIGRGKTLVMLFFNPSLRTRLSTQKAAYNLGMNVMSLNVSQAWGLEFEDGAVMRLDKAEHVREAAAVISQYGDIIGVRTFPGLEDRELDYRDFVLRQFVRYATVPVINLESATLHPLQSFADLLTIETQKSRQRPKVVLSWAPHPRALPQAVANSFLEWMKTADCELILTHPPGYELAPQFAAGCAVEYDPRKAFEGADFIYAKNWSSYFDYGKVLLSDSAWMITPEKMALTRDAYFMHCLPVRRNVVVADKVLDSARSLVIMQAANRTITAQAVLKMLLEQNPYS